MNDDVPAPASFPVAPTRIRALALLVLVSALLGGADAASADEQTVEALSEDLRSDCAWLSEAIAGDPDRDDAFGVVMEALRERCRSLVPRLADESFEPGSAERMLHEELASLRSALGPPRTSEPAGDRPQARPSERDEPPPDAEGDGEDTIAHGITGTWQQEPDRRLDYFVKRRLELVEAEDGSVSGRLVEETWKKAPLSWVEGSCDGNPIFRAVKVAAVRGEVDGGKLTLLRDRPRVARCTCGSRCRVERRRRGYTYAIAAGGDVLRDGERIFVRAGASRVPRRDGGSGRGDEAGAAAVGGTSLGGAWETEPFERAGATRLVRLELEIEGGEVSGVLRERVSQKLPLASWRDRFCDGHDRFEFVHTFEVYGDADEEDGELGLRFRDAEVRDCTCPSKCRTPRRRRGLVLVRAPGGAALEGGGLEFRRAE